MQHSRKLVSTSSDSGTSAAYGHFLTLCGFVGEGIDMATIGRLNSYFKILEDLNRPITEGTKVLDLGCGSGRLVHQGRSKNIEFFGCDFHLHDDDETADSELVNQGVLRKIDESHYRIPFEDCSFDFVISDQVLEHVMDYPTTLREIQRVLKPGGAFLHIFPARYKILEPHVFVPFGTVLRSRWWLKSWALIGIRNRFQRDMSAAEACAANLEFLTLHTNYLPKRTLQRLFSEHYTDVQFVEHLFLKHGNRGRKVYELSTWLPFLPKLYSAVGSRVAFGRRGDLGRMR